MFESISVKGKQRAVPSLQVGPKAFVVIIGTGIRIGSVHDEFWLESKDIPEPEEIIEIIRRSDIKIDLFTFAQKLPDISPHYSYHLEWDSMAVSTFRS